MKYIRTKDGRIIPTDIATYELTQDICCAGYYRKLKKGSCVTIGKEWTNFYGRWVDIIDEKGTHYSIRPDEVKEVTKELKQADTIEELCDEFVIISGEVKQIDDDYKSVLEWTKQAFEEYKIKSIIYGAIWTDKALIYVAKMNNKGELELL